MTGGNDVMKIKAKAISHPPGKARHFLDTGPSQSKKALEYNTVTTSNTQHSRMNAPTATCCSRGSVRYPSHVFFAHVRYFCHISRAYSLMFLGLVVLLRRLLRRPAAALDSRRDADADMDTDDDEWCRRVHGTSVSTSGAGLPPLLPDVGESWNWFAMFCLFSAESAGFKTRLIVARDPKSSIPLYAMIVVVVGPRKKGFGVDVTLVNDAVNHSNSKYMVLSK